MKTIYYTLISLSILFSLKTFSNCTTTRVLQYINMSASLKEDLVEIKWEINNSYPNTYFFIEKSIDGISFIVIDSVFEAASGLKYEYIDTNPSEGISYYRVRYRDSNTNEHFSNISYIEFYGTPTSKRFEIINLFPIPFIKNINMNIKCKYDLIITIKILDSEGKLLTSFTENCTKGLNHINIPETYHNINDNSYYIVVSDELSNEKINRVIKHTAN